MLTSLILQGGVPHDAAWRQSEESLYPKPVDFRKSIDGLSALVGLDIKAAVFDPVLFVFLNRARNRVKILYWERNGFCLWLKRLEAERFKAPPDPSDEAIELTAEELNWMLDGFDLWRNRPHKVVLAMLLTTKYADGLPLHRFEKVLKRHGIDEEAVLSRLLLPYNKGFTSAGLGRKTACLSGQHHKVRLIGSRQWLARSASVS